MITVLLGENQDDIDFKVYTVQADCPPKNFGVDQGWSKKFPVIMVLSGRNKNGQDISNMKYDEFETLETFFESINRSCPELKRKNAPNLAAMEAVQDVYPVRPQKTCVMKERIVRMRGGYRCFFKYLKSKRNFTVDVSVPKSCYFSDMHNLMLQHLYRKYNGKLSALCHLRSLKLSVRIFS